MSGSTTRPGLGPKVLRLSCIALLVLAVGCGNNLKDEFKISVDEDRAENGVLEGLTVNGKGFSPNSTVLVTFVLAASGGTTNPYVEQETQTDGEGKFKLEARPVPCPQPADYRAGVFNLVVARDQSSGISGSSTLSPGEQPDCRGNAG